jgi:OmpA-OmpF porin, OOP family
MRNRLWGAAVAAFVWTAPVGAVHTEKYQIPYFGVAAQYLATDSARESDAGEGFQLSFGVPLENPRHAVELRFFDGGFSRDIDDKKDYQSGLFVDYVVDLGPMFGGGEDGFLSYVKPFAVAGLGFIEEDVRADKHLHFGFNAGGGVIVPIGFKGWAVRLDMRAQPQSNNESAPAEDFLIDYQVNLGIQMPLTAFFDKPVAVAPVADCPVAVVDPETGRRDCAADSDGDGVGDTLDECPGTSAGTPVDRKGCPQVKESTDGDGDGVPNSRDKCPETQKGLQVNSQGCVIAQKTSIKGVTFQANSANLTAEGRATLDGVADTLKDQEDLKVEIAGHTDAIGSEAYNTLLSQQRAEAVRAYLAEKGVDEDRMSAVGYGELEPVDSNETDEGRKANRRVEFRISTD